MVLVVWGRRLSSDFWEKCCIDSVMRVSGSFSIFVRVVGFGYVCFCFCVVFSRIG